MIDDTDVVSIECEICGWYSPVNTGNQLKWCNCPDKGGNTRIGVDGDSYSGRYLGDWDRMIFRDIKGERVI